MAHTSAAATTATTLLTTKNTTLTLNTQNFGNSLFSDLAPLLALFGDETTKQFISTSMGWGDNLLLAIGPLGIMATLVSAIRIAGGKLLKSFIGRARESPDEEEKEILSSTSSSVREIWNGDRVVRQTGESKTVELVCIKTENDFRFRSLGQALTNDGGGEVSCPVYHIANNEHPNLHANHNIESQNASTSSTEKIIGDVAVRNLAEELKIKAPNLTLNIPGALPESRTTWTMAFLGATIQTIVLIFGALVTYHWKWPRGSFLVASYGYPTWVAGTVSLSLGMLLCARVIQESTRVFIVEPATNGILSAEIVRYQSRIPNLNLPAYAISMGGTQHPRVHISQRIRPASQQKDARGMVYDDLDAKGYARYLKFLTYSGCFLSLSGFICQNIGTRELHWSVGVLQLGAMVILATIRSLLRRHVGNKVPDAIRLRIGYEGSQLACHIQRCTHWKSITSLCNFNARSNTAMKATFVGDYPYEKRPYNEMLYRVYKSQMYLTRFAPDPDEVSSVCSNLCAAIQEVLDLLQMRGLSWNMYIEVGGENLPLLSLKDGEVLPESIIAVKIFARPIADSWQQDVQSILRLTVNDHLSKLQTWHGVGKKELLAENLRFTHTIGTVQTDDARNRYLTLTRWIGRRRILTLSRTSNRQFLEVVNWSNPWDHKTFLDLNSGTIGLENLDRAEHCGLQPGMTVALELVATFFSSLASSSTASEKLKTCIESSTTELVYKHDRRLFGLGYYSYIYTNTFFDSLLDILVKNQVGTLEDATVAVIPAFLNGKYVIPKPSRAEVERLNAHRRQQGYTEMTGPVRHGNTVPSPPPSPASSPSPAPPPPPPSTGELDLSNRDLPVGNQRRELQGEQEKKE